MMRAMHAQGVVVARARRNYTDEEKAAGLAVLALHGGDASKAARAAGVPRRTLQRWRDESPEVVAQIAQEKKDDLAGHLEEIARTAAGIIAVALPLLRQEPALALKFLADLNRIMGTAIDKRQLLLDLPTENMKQAAKVEVVVRREDRPIRASD